MNTATIHLRSHVAPCRGLPPADPESPRPEPRFRNQHVLTKGQQEHVDRERRWAADHMRQLNQVLAGHVSYHQVPKFHGDSVPVNPSPSPAPSHGSAVEDSPPDGAKAEANKNRGRESSARSDRRGLYRGVILRELVRDAEGKHTGKWVETILVGAVPAVAHDRVCSVPPVRIVCLGVHRTVLWQGGRSESLDAFGSRHCAGCDLSRSVQRSACGLRRVAQRLRDKKAP